ncbi:MAG: hypothetical protein IJU19_09110 [Bacteroidales bacterium]|nr:hypothetical protein [Bacteroidales bacterium]
MTNEEQMQTVDRMARRLAMAYLVGAAAECYLTEAVDDIRRLGLYRQEVKHRIGLALQGFEVFDSNTKWLCLFDTKKNPGCGHEIIESYEVLKAVLDGYMNGITTETSAE